MSPPEPKRCLGCGYILDHLPEPRCPECGRGFDPDDEETYIARMVDGFTPLRNSLLAIGAMLAAFGVHWLLSAMDPLEENDALQLWVGSLRIGFGALGLVVELAAIMDALRALRLPRFAVLHRGAAYAALALVLVPMTGCLHLLATR